jgi:hypothetical protein
VSKFGFFNIIFGIFSMFAINSSEMFSRSAVSPAVQKTEICQKPDDSASAPTTFQPW